MHSYHLKRLQALKPDDYPPQVNFVHQYYSGLHQIPPSLRTSYSLMRIIFLCRALLTPIVLPFGLMIINIEQGHMPTKKDQGPGLGWHCAQQLIRGILSTQTLEWPHIRHLSTRYLAENSFLCFSSCSSTNVVPARLSPSSLQQESQKLYRRYLSNGMDWFLRHHNHQI